MFQSVDRIGAPFQRRISRVRVRHEHVPVNCYHLLRRLAQGAVHISSLHGVEDESAVEFLLSRGLARSSDGLCWLRAGGPRSGEAITRRPSGRLARRAVAKQSPAHRLSAPMAKN